MNSNIIIDAIYLGPLCAALFSTHFNLVSKSFDCVVNNSLLFALLLLLLFPLVPSVNNTSDFCCCCCIDDWSVGISKRLSSSGMVSAIFDSLSLVFVFSTFYKKICGM